MRMTILCESAVLGPYSWHFHQQQHRHGKKIVITIGFLFWTCGFDILSKRIPNNSVKNLCDLHIIIIIII